MATPRKCVFKMVALKQTPNKPFVTLPDRVCAVPFFRFKTILLFPSKMPVKVLVADDPKGSYHTGPKYP